MDTIAIKWKSKDLQNRNTLHIIIRSLYKETNKYVYYHIQRRLVDKETVKNIGCSCKILRKYKDIYYIQELEGHPESTWFDIIGAIEKLKRTLNETN